MVGSYDHMGGPCPRCGDHFEVFPALSRYDNATYICSPCGVTEALYNFAYPGEPLPPVHIGIRA